MSSPVDWFEVEALKEDPKTDAATALKNKIKKEKKEDIFAKAPCPDNPEVTYTEKQCEKCEKRNGCPSW